MPRPKITTYSLASLDGKLTTSPDTLLLFGDERWNRCAGASEDAYKWLMPEFQPDALLEGSGSLVLTGQPVEPLPESNIPETILRKDHLPTSVVRIPGRKWLTVVDSRGLIRWMYKEFPGDEWAGWHILVLVSKTTPLCYLAYLRKEEIPYLVCGDDRVNLSLAVDKMAQLGVHKIVSTAGGKLSGALLREGLVDEVCVEFFPALIGGQSTPSLFNAPDLLPGEQPLPLELDRVETLPNQHIRMFYHHKTEAA
jgi:riboflavin biosynthesis pyrimidine reductase